MGVRGVHMSTVLACALLAAGSLTACTSSPQSQPPPSTGSDVLPSPYRSLVDEAREKGSVKVIVTLAMPWRPEGELPDQDAVQRQRAEIQAAQGRLLDELKPFKVEVGTRFRLTPQLSLTVDEAALRHLATSPLVKSVHENQLNHTTS
jgi:hypothetical protein